MATKTVCKKAVEEHGARVGQMPGVQGISWGASIRSKKKDDYRMFVYVDMAQRRESNIPRYVVVRSGNARKHVYTEIVEQGVVEKEVMGREAIGKEAIGKE